MSNFVEIDVDFGYCGEVEMVLAHDEGGEHEDVEFYRDGLLAEDNAKLRGRVAELEELTDGKHYIPQEWYAQLNAENERLHEYVTKLEQANIVLDSDNTELRNDMKDMQMIVADNHKLRELVRDYYIYEHRDCDSCRFYDDCHSVGCASRAPFCIAPIRLGERTRELGVEVDDD